MHMRNRLLVYQKSKQASSDEEESSQEDDEDYLLQQRKFRMMKLTPKERVVEHVKIITILLWLVYLTTELQYS